MGATNRSDNGTFKAMISSTALDLPEHRKQVVDACLRLGVLPIGMEQLPARDASGVQASLEMVDKANIYIGIYAWRYGWIPDVEGVPNPDRISITEMEFNRALERKREGKLKEILIFLMHEDHPIRARDIEQGDEAQAKLRAFKKRASDGRVVLTFTSPEELRTLAVQSIGEAIHRIEEAEAGGEARAPSIHPPNVIAAAPEPYTAHPYSLLQTDQVIGRQGELNMLTDWVTTNRQVPGCVRLFNIVAIGGMGKSALAWKWWNDIAPHELPALAGRMWWSFYESDATYENFIIRALAYATCQSEEAVRQMKAPDREDQLWRILDSEPFLLVLDGLERILLAYARMDAAHMADDDLDERTANYVAHTRGLPPSAAQSFTGKHQLRLTADRRAGLFLRRLTGVRASRILITTRLYPAELQAVTDEPWPGCFAAFLTGLTDDDALNLWRAFKVTGAREQLLPIFRSFGNYPLLVRALAGEVATYRAAPGDFAAWREANPHFDPAKLSLVNAKTHVLEYALAGLGEQQRQVLHTLAAFRMPATWSTIRALLVGEGKTCQGDRALDAVLTELEDRGLVGWDKRANRYDLHPIVRGVVWSALAPNAKQGLLSELHTYFEAMPRPPEWREVERIEDLTPAIELFDKLIALERYEEAFVIFRDHLDLATLYRLSASRLRVELLERLFVDGVAELPRLETPRDQSYALNALALAYDFGGEPGRAVPLFRRAAEIDERQNDEKAMAVKIVNHALALWPSGHLREAEQATRRALALSRQEKDDLGEGASLIILGLALAVRGEAGDSAIALRRSLAMWMKLEHQQGEGYVSATLAQRCLWLAMPKEALALVQRAWQLANVRRQEADFVRAARLHGWAALALGDLATAGERLHHALTRARAVNLAEEELPALNALAELLRQRHEYAAGRELLDQVWQPAGRGPYPLLHADARNTLARIERDEGHRDLAIAAATRAYELAWCDGPPYAYHYGLENAKALLAELGAAAPQLPPFDASKFEAMPDVEINPKDEFWIDPASLDHA